MKDNTVGSRSSIKKAYIAGFLDGDGSLMLQIKRRKDIKSGFRFMATICFYQDTRHEKYLYDIQKTLSCGYISRRNDHITELRINGYSTVLKVLLDLEPFIRFKKVQAKALIKACEVLLKSANRLSKDDLLVLVELVLVIQTENYKSHSKKTKQEILKILGLTP